MDELVEISRLYETARRIGRNDPCWCGSGQKYKRCHLDRAREVPATMQEIITEQRRIAERRVCLHAEASPTVCKRVIKAHSLQRSEIRKIARSGKVYGIEGDFVTRTKTGGELEAKLIGVGEASTFYGFCENHDAPTFAPLEKEPFVGTPQQCYLLAYRVICRELYAKENQWQLVPFTRTLDRGKPLESQIDLQYRMRNYQQGVELGLSDLRGFKAAYDEALIRSDYSDVHYYVIRLASTPELVCAGGTLPEYDFLGRTVQQLSSSPLVRQEHITFSLVPTTTGGAGVFCWLGTSSAGEQLVRSLDTLSDADVPHALVRFAFSSFENVFAAPDWWEALDENVRASYVRRMNTGASMASFEPGPRDLMDDGVRAVTWTVVGRDTNVIRP